MDLKIIRWWERKPDTESTYYMLHLHVVLEVKVIYSDKKEISVSPGDMGEVEWVQQMGLWGFGAEGDGTGYTGEYICQNTHNCILKIHHNFTTM